MKKFGKLIDRKNPEEFEEEFKEGVKETPVIFESKPVFFKDFIYRHDDSYNVLISEVDAQIAERNLRKAFLFVDPERAVEYIVYWGLISGKREDSSMIAYLLGSTPNKIVRHIVKIDDFISEELSKLANDDPKTVKKFSNTPDTTYTEILEDYLAEREDKDSLAFRYLNMIAKNSKEAKTFSK